MAKRFKAKKRHKFKLFKIIIILVLIILFIQILFNYILKLNIASSNEEFIRKMLNDSNHHMIYEKYNNNLSNKIIKALANIDIKKPTTILTKNFGYKINNDINGKNIAVASDVDEKSIYI